VYITTTLVKAKYATLLEQVTRGVVSDALVQKWIDDSEGKVNFYVTQRYDLPFTNIPQIITTCAYELFEYYWQKGTDTPPATRDTANWIFPRYDRTIADLKAIANGSLTLSYVDPSTGIETTIDPRSDISELINSNHIETAQIFSQKDFVDQDLEDAYSDEPELT
jgi:phage gp36-like protein